jgi:hypothetical protein
VPRYIAKRPIRIGGALAFAAGAQVPEGHVERFDLLDGGLDGPAVVEVSDDVVGSRPDLADGVPDNTPATVSIGERLLYGDFDAPPTGPDEPPADLEAAGDSSTPEPQIAIPASSKTKAEPATGTTTSTVTEG